MKNDLWCFKKCNKSKWYLIPIDMTELFEELVNLNQLEILSDQFDEYMVNDIRDYYFERPEKYFYLED